MKSSLFLLILVYKFSSCQRRIVGGSDAKDGMFPYAAYVLTNRMASCTGSLLTDEWVLTAAHCMGYDPILIEITAGAANKNSKDAQIRKGQKIIMHEKYIPRLVGAYDIALIKVDVPFNMSSKNIGTIALSSDEWPQDNQKNVSCKALGWGRMSMTGGVPDVLQVTDVVAKHGESGCPCVKRFEQKKLVCLEGMFGKGPCLGDSGGPLVCNGKEVGITHIGFNKKKCDPIYHDVPKIVCGHEDTVVTYFYLCPELDWIRQFIPVIPATPKSCSAILQCSHNTRLIIILAFIAVFHKYI